MSKDGVERSITSTKFIPVIDETDTLSQLDSWYTEFERVEALRAQAVRNMEEGDKDGDNGDNVRPPLIVIEENIVNPEDVAEQTDGAKALGETVITEEGEGDEHGADKEKPQKVIQSITHNNCYVGMLHICTFS